MAKKQLLNISRIGQYQIGRMYSESTFQQFGTCEASTMSVAICCANNEASSKPNDLKWDLSSWLVFLSKDYNHEWRTIPCTFPREIWIATNPNAWWSTLLPCKKGYNPRIFNCLNVQGIYQTAIPSRTYAHAAVHWRSLMHNNNWVLHWFIQCPLEWRRQRDILHKY